MTKIIMNNVVVKAKNCDVEISTSVLNKHIAPLKKIHPLKQYQPIKSNYLSSFLSGIKDNKSSIGSRLQFGGCYK